MKIVTGVNGTLNFPNVRLAQLKADEKWIINAMGNMFEADKTKARRELANIRKQIRGLK